MKDMEPMDPGIELFLPTVGGEMPEPDARLFDASPWLCELARLEVEHPDAIRGTGSLAAKRHPRPFRFSIRCRRRAIAGLALIVGLTGVMLPAQVEAVGRNATTFYDLYAQPDTAFLGRAIRQTQDGGYVMVGVQTTTENNIVVVRTDSLGGTIWQKVYTVPGQSSDGWSVEQTSNGFIVVGILGPTDGPWVLITMSLDVNGGLLWNGSYPTGGRIGALPWSVEQTADGGYLLAATNYDAHNGRTSDPLWILRLDAAGTIVWQKTYSLSATSLHVTEDNGAIAAGMGNCAPVCAPEIVKLDADGNPVWKHRYPVGLGDAFASSARPTADGGYLVAGNYYSTGAVSNALVMKIDREGQLVWQRAYAGSPCGAGMGAYDARPVAGGTLLMMAIGCTAPGIAKIDAEGNLLWQESTNGAGSQVVLTTAFEPTSDGGFIATGSSLNPVVPPTLLALKADRNGEVTRCARLRLRPLDMTTVVPPTIGVQDLRVNVERTAVESVHLTVTTSELGLSRASACRPSD